MISAANIAYRVELTARAARDLEFPIDTLIAILEIALIECKGGGGGNDEHAAQGNE